MARKLGVTGAMVALLSIGGATGCGVFGANDDGETGETGDGDGDGDGDGETGGVPDVGIRVFPKYKLVDVPAVVTIEVDLMPVGCAFDDIGGGYVCDTSPVTSTTATIVVERDGFDPATRHPDVPYGQVVDLEVHLNDEGGPTGVWSACVAAGDAATCDDVCENAASTCTPVSCATEDGEWPLATYQTFANADCMDTAVENAALACDGALPEGGGDVGSLRCCCAA